MPTTIVRYVNTNSPAGGNGTTPSITAGDANRAYRSISASLAAENIAYPNLVTSDIILKIECAGGSDIFTSALIVPTFTTDFTRYLWIYCAPENGHVGIWNGSNYLITHTGNSSNFFQLGGTKNITFEGLQVENRSTNGVWTVLSQTSTPADTYYTINRCFLRSISGSGNQGSGITMPTSVRKGLRMYNSIIQGNFLYAVNVDFIATAASQSVLYNNTLIGAVTGMNFTSNSGRGIILRNNIISASRCYSTAGTVISSTNISSDATSPDVAFRNLVPSFVSTVTSSANFSLLNSDTVAKGAGTNLATDVSYSFAFDAASTRRPTRFGRWDIGALQNQNIQNSATVSATTGNPVVISSTVIGKSIEGSI